VGLLQEAVSIPLLPPADIIELLSRAQIAGEKSIPVSPDQLLLHALVIGSLIGLLYAAFRSPRIRNPWRSIVCHPAAQVSTTAWIGGRTDLLSELFLLLFAWT